MGQKQMLIYGDETRMFQKWVWRVTLLLISVEIAIWVTVIFYFWYTAPF